MVSHHPIPPRESSRYSGQYDRSTDSDRLTTIFTESAQLALNSRSPDTAQARFQLAVEAYHRLMQLPLPPDRRSALHTAMSELADHFPSLVLGNQVLGMCDKANRFKTVKRQLATLLQAREILERGIAMDDVGREGLSSLLEQVDAYIKRATALSGPQAG